MFWLQDRPIINTTNLKFLNSGMEIAIHQKVKMKIGIELFLYV